MKKKYILKPGVHQIEPGSRDQYTNETMTDELAEGIIKRFPDAILFFEKIEVETPKVLPVSNPVTAPTQGETK